MSEILAISASFDTPSRSRQTAPGAQTVETSETASYVAALRRLLPESRRRVGLHPPESVPAFRQPGDALALLRADAGQPAPALACLAEAQAGQILSAALPLDGSGLAPALAACCIEADLGAILSSDSLPPRCSPEESLFGARDGEILVAVAKERIPDLSALAAAHGVELCCLGMLGGERLLVSGSRGVWMDVGVRELEVL